MTGRSRSNPLALAVLALLFEAPMHPYELAMTMRERHKEESIKLNYGTLYSVMGSLDKRGLVRVKEVVRDGRRPERTIYEITEAGRLELNDWLSDLIATPSKEYTDFEAGLSLMGVLEPEIVLRLLEERQMRLNQFLNGTQAMYDTTLKEGLPRLHLIEMEYVLVLRRAEMAWVSELIGQLRDGSLDGLDMWREWLSQAGEPPDPT